MLAMQAFQKPLPKVRNQCTHMHSTYTNDPDCWLLVLNGYNSPFWLELVLQVFCSAIWELELNFVFPSALPLVYFIIPSSTPLLHSLVFLPRLYSLSLGVPFLLPDWCAGLQLCTCTHLSFSAIPNFYFTFLLVLPPLANMAHRTLHSPFQPQT